MASGGGSIPTVLLGLEDAPLSPSEESRSDMTVSRLGGRPDWPAPAPAAAPLPTAVCDRCSRPQPLVVQIYAPIGASAYHRTLYVFGCVSPECVNETGAWRCVRAQQRAEPVRSEPAPAARAAPAAAAADWLDSADDWGDDDDGWGDDGGDDVDNSSSGGNIDISSNTGGSGCGDGLSALAPKLHDLALDVDNANLAASGDPPAASAEVEPSTEEGVSPEAVAPPSGDLRALLTARPALPSGTVTFRPSYLSVIEEPAPRSAASHHELDLLRQYQAREGINMAQLSSTAPTSGGGGGGTAAAAAESYERALPAHGDRLLYKLIQRLELCPSQVLRYGRDGGSPLPIAPLPVNWSPRCVHCGGPTVFELQLLPTLVSRLRVTTPDGRGERTGLLEFGTVIVYTCRDSCWAEGDSTRTETVLVQAEMQ